MIVSVKLLHNSLRKSPLDKLTLLAIYFKYLHKFNFLFKNAPSFFWYGVCTILLLSRINTGWFGFLILREKVTSWACLRISRLKLIFHWYVQLLIFSWSSFKALADKFVCRITKKKQLSSAKSLGFDDNWFDKQVMSIENIRGPKIGLCGTPALTAPYLGTSPFKITFWYLFAKKVFHDFIKFPDVPLYFNFSGKPWRRQTLSKAFDILRKIPLTSRPV